MPLADFQAALGTMVTVGATAQTLPTSQLNLSRDDVAWLGSLPDAPGFKVTCAIQRWWRETRLRSLARLTLAALGAEQAAQFLTTYLQANLCTSLFFLPETLAFLRFVESHTDNPQLAAIARFEAALLLAKEEVTQPQLPETPTTTYIEFAAPPEEILSALLQGLPLPSPRTERFPVWVSSALPHFWCPATFDEA